MFPFFNIKQKSSTSWKPIFRIKINGYSPFETSKLQPKFLLEQKQKENSSQNREKKLRATHSAFFDDLKRDLKIIDPEDWGKVTVNQVIQKGGRKILRVHKNSLFRALNFAYPEQKWRRSDFQFLASVGRDHWKGRIDQMVF
jgi:hypothetical protein